MNEIINSNESIKDKHGSWYTPAEKDIIDVLNQNFDIQKDGLETQKTWEKIEELFWLKSKESIEFKWKMIEYFKFYTDKIIPITTRRRGW